MERTIYTESEALQFIQENDVRFIKLFFTDVYGVLKSFSIQPTELSRAFSEGISFDASAVPGFLGVAESDLFIVPDPSTLCVLPWRPREGRVVRFFCSIFRSDGTPFEGDTRRLLFDFSESQRARGIELNVGTECEFYLFKLGEDGYPSKEPHDRARYCDLAPKDKGENVRREICLTLEQMGVHPISSHHETGPGQNEVDFQHADALTAADNVQTFRTVVSTVSAKNGLFASFLPKPLENEAGNGFHVNISLFRRGENIFLSKDAEVEREANAFVAGLLRRAREISAFVNPLASSYKRFGVFEAPAFVSHSHENRSQLIRIPSAKGERARIEFRQPDPAANPYLALYLILRAGIEGMDDSLTLPPELNIDLYNAPKETLSRLEKLPSSLAEALESAKKSEFLKNALPARTLEFFLNEPIDHDYAFGDF